MSRKWTAEEEQLLKELYDKNIPDIEIAERLGRTKNAIHIKRGRLGLTDIHKRRFPQESLESIRSSRKKYSMKNHPGWKGGRRKNHAGYIEIKKPNHHRTRKNGYVFEHILVAEEMIGRKLKPNEHVHHINGIKTDNRPENLKVLDAGEHTRLHAPSRRKGVNKKCEYCGSEFYCKPSHVNKRKTCSRSCHAKLNGFGYSRKIDLSEETILKVLKSNNNNVKQSAKELNIHYSTLYRKIKRLGECKNA